MTITAEGVEIPIPDVMAPVLLPYQYKVLWGGRGGLRSWTCARYILGQMYTRPVRVLCVREVQKSLAQSVWKLLKDQIKLLELGHVFNVTKGGIFGKNGSEVMFAGLSDQTADSLKSYEGVNITWAEEAHTITANSWDILLPTIFRREDSELLVSFNPGLETDETYVRFVKNPPEDSVVLFTTYKDAQREGLFPAKLDKERKHFKKTHPKEYPNIWEGKLKPAVEGAIYYDEVQASIEAGRICNVPYDPMLKVHVVLDLGKGNSLFTSLVQKHLSEIRIIKAFQGGHFNWNTWTHALKQNPYNWGRVWLPHDGFTSRMDAPSAEYTLKRLGWDVVPEEGITKLGLEEGIRHTRVKFAQFYFDKKQTPDLVEALKRYRRHINATTKAETDPVHDEWSHGADNARYIALNADSMTNEDYEDDDLDLSGVMNPRDATVGI